MNIKKLLVTAGILCLAQGTQASEFEVTRSENIRLYLSALGLGLCQGIEIPYKNLAGRNLSGGNFKQANFTHAWLDNTNLENANLEGANLNCAHLVFTSLRNANLENATCLHANIHTADITGANLMGADLSHASHTTVCGELRGFEKAYLCGTKLPNGQTSYRDCDQSVEEFRAAMEAAENGTN